MRALVYTEPGPGRAARRAGARRPAPPRSCSPCGPAGSAAASCTASASPGCACRPLVMGHEFVGTTPDGRRVAVNPLLSCGECDSCTAGRPQVCRRRGLLGVHRAGGFAERVAVPTLGAARTARRPRRHGRRADRAARQRGARLVAAARRAPPGSACSAPARSGCSARWSPPGTAPRCTVSRPERAPPRGRRAARAATPCAALEEEFDAVLDAVGAPATRQAGLEPGSVRPAPPSGSVSRTTRSTLSGNALVRGEQVVRGSFAYTPAEFAEAVALAPELDLSWTTTGAARAVRRGLLLPRRGQHRDRQGRDRAGRPADARARRTRRAGQRRHQRDRARRRAALPRGGLPGLRHRALRRRRRPGAGRPGRPRRAGRRPGGGRPRRATRCARPSTPPTRRAAGITVLANNAGIARRTPFLDIDVADWREILDVNLTGMFAVAQAFARTLVRRRPHRLDRQHGLHQRLRRRGGLRPLQRLQGRGGAADPVDGRRAGRARHPGERAVPRLHRHPAEQRHRRRADGGLRRAVRQRAHPARPRRAGSTRSPRRTPSWPATRRPSCTARRSSSTAASWR